MLISKYQFMSKELLLDKLPDGTYSYDGVPVQNQLVGKQEAADLLGISKSSVERLVGVREGNKNPTGYCKRKVDRKVLIDFEIISKAARQIGKYMTRTS